MRKIMVVVLLVRQLQHGFTKNAKVSPNLTVALISISDKSIKDSDSGAQISARKYNSCTCRVSIWFVTF